MRRCSISSISRAWNLDVLRQTWYSVVFSSGHVQRVNGKYVLAGDGVKTPKEALRMPGVKKHFQESEDSSKVEFIHGHMFGAVGAVIGKGTDSFCVPLRMGIQEGHAGDCILLLDRLFLTTQAIRLMGELNLCIICGTTFLPLWHQTLIRQ